MEIIYDVIDVVTSNDVCGNADIGCDTNFDD